MIYIITNKLNNKRYIGKTAKTIEERWYQHCKNAEYGVDTYLYRAIRKYGSENFSVEFLCDGLDEEEVIQIEQLQPEYNMTKGGTGGDTSSSPGYKAAIAERDMSGPNNPMFGRKGAENPNFGRKATPEQRERNKQAYRGKRIPVIIDGVNYPSVYEAAQQLGRSERYVRLHDERNTWSY